MKVRIFLLKLRNGLIRISDYVEDLVSIYYEKKYFKELIAGTKDIIKNTKQQNREIKLYFRSKVGIRTVPTYYHEYYHSMNNIYSHQYIPDRIFYKKIIPALYHKDLINAYDDKNITEYLFPNILQPKTILKRMNGFFYLNNKAVNKEDAVKACANLNDVVIKPVLYTSGGTKVRKMSCSNGITSMNKKNIEEVFNLYGNNFIIQEVIHQHHDLALLNESSVQTLRIVTYRRPNEVVILCSLIRIGRRGSFLDNGTAGGFCCGCNSDGTLKKYGYTFNPTTKITHTDNGTELEGFQIPSYSKTIEIAEELHYSLPHFIMIGWDFTINEKGEVVLIELNPNFGIHIMQLTSGPAFGKYTDEILEKMQCEKLKQ